MDKLNYKICVGYMPVELDGSEMVRVVFLDGSSVYDEAKFIDWTDVDVYAVVGEE